jgi:hypothetical protein
MDLRSVGHLNYDINLCLLRKKDEWQFIHDHQDEIFGKLHRIILRMRILKKHETMDHRRNFPKNEILSTDKVRGEQKRVFESLSEMESLVTSLEYRLGNIKGLNIEIDF